jgi:DNA-binding transcriptional MerR regulator
MAKHNIKEAARLAGVNRTTLYTYMKEGRISWETLPNGNRVIDTAELSRVFGTLQRLNTNSMSTNQHNQHTQTVDSAREVSLLQEQIEALRQHVQAAETDKTDLRQRLDQAERRAERAEEERRLVTGFLEDLRPKPPASKERQRRWWFW